MRVSDLVVFFPASFVVLLEITGGKTVGSHTI